LSATAELDVIVVKRLRNASMLRKKVAARMPHSMKYPA
jgi:hypothetical protein